MTITVSQLVTFIITFASLLGALASIFAVLYKILKWFENQKKQDEKIKELEDRHKEDVKEIRAEQRVICTGVFACLDGLEQLGCNHTVPKAKEQLEEHLNKIAHQ